MSSQVLITKSKLDSLANTIASKASAAAPLTIAQMETAVRNIPTGGGSTLIAKDITANGTYNAQDDSADGYSSVAVNVPAPTPSLQYKTKSYTPSELNQSDQVFADSGYDGLGSVSISVGAVASDYVGSAINRRTSFDLSVSEATVTVPAGYYANEANKSIASGSATIPTTISGNSATVSTGANTITLTGTALVTPVVRAGYISNGTAGNASVSLTADVTTKATATITPTKSTQTIDSGTYLTGIQTIAAIPAAYQDVTQVDATAGDVASGKKIVNSSGTVVTGTLAFQTIYSGSSAPSSSTGVNGDVYIQTA